MGKFTPSRKTARKRKSFYPAVKGLNIRLPEKLHYAHIPANPCASPGGFIVNAFYKCVYDIYRKGAFCETGRMPEQWYNQVLVIWKFLSRTGRRQVSWLTAFGMAAFPMTQWLRFRLVMPFRIQ